MQKLNKAEDIFTFVKTAEYRELRYKDTESKQNSRQSPKNSIFKRFFKLSTDGATPNLLKIFFLTTTDRI